MIAPVFGREEEGEVVGGDVGVEVLVGETVDWAKEESGAGVRGKERCILVGEKRWRKGAYRPHSFAHYPHSSCQLRGGRHMPSWERMCPVELSRGT
jgi:hypothetical protein